MALPVTLVSAGGLPVALTDERYTNGQISVPIILASSAVAVSHTGNTSETVLATVTIPAGLMGLNGALRLFSLWSTPGGSGNNKTPRARFGNGLSGTTFFGVNVTTTLSYSDGPRILQNRNSAASQVVRTTNSGTGTSTAAVAALTIDTTASQVVVLTGQLANGSDTITLEQYSLELLLP